MAVFVGRNFQYRWLVPILIIIMRNGCATTQSGYNCYESNVAVFLFRLQGVWLIVSLFALFIETLIIARSCVITATLINSICLPPLVDWHPVVRVLGPTIWEHNNNKWGEDVSGKSDQLYRIEWRMEWSASLYFHIFRPLQSDSTWSKYNVPTTINTRDKL